MLLTGCTDTLTGAEPIPDQGKQTVVTSHADDTLSVTTTHEQSDRDVDGGQKIDFGSDLGIDLPSKPDSDATINAIDACHNLPRNDCDDDGEADHNTSPED